MPRATFAARLAELERARSRASANLLLDEIAPDLPFAAPDHRIAVQALLAARGIDFTLPAARLRVGETWLLLYEAPGSGWAVRLRAVAEPTPDTTLLGGELGRAHRALVTAAGRCGRRLPTAAPPGIEIDAPVGRFQVEGGSLGLSVAVATLSMGLAKAPRIDCAGSAQVFEGGELRPVEHLEAKIETVCRTCPELRGVVVARHQPVPAGYRCAVELVRADSLAEALPHFGLRLTELRHRVTSIEELQDSVRRLRIENARAHTIGEWQRLVHEACELAVALEEDDPESAGQSRVWGALFAVHAGDADTAEALVKQISEAVANQYPALQARKRIISATSLIDGPNCHEAIQAAADAVELCRALPSSESRELLGQALGTHGRAFLHAGRHAEAEPLLRLAADHHHAAKPQEEPRSLSYLATCLRLAGRPEDALDVVDRALARAEIDAEKKWDVAATTRLYLRLERGRVLAALQRWPEAASELLAVREGQQGELDYPRLGAVQSLPRVLRRAGRTAEAEQALAGCVAVARRLAASERTSILARVAAVAAAEALLDAAADQCPSEALAEAVRAAFGEEPSFDVLKRIVERSVY